MLKKRFKATPTFWLFLFITFIFLWWRLYKLPSSLLFFNDIGRDLLVLWQSWTNKNIFLLGPQNSALPFNQSAVYFYWLYPIYILSGMSTYTHTITLLLTSLALMLFGFYLLNKHRQLQWIWLGALWLLAIQPQQVLQNRFVWNPSFVSLFLLTSLISWWRWEKQEKSNQWLLWSWAIFLSLAVAFTYSVVPVMLAWIIIIVWQLRLKSWTALWRLGVATLIWQIPTIIFELKYKFSLTRAILAGGRTAQEGTGWLKKSDRLLEFLLGSNQTSGQLLLIFLAVLIAINLYQIFTHWRQPKPNNSQRDKVFLFSFSLLLLTLAITYILPIAVHAHYIFGIMTLGVVVIASLRLRWLGAGLLVLTLFWLQPRFLNRYFAPASRTIADLEKCAQQVCQQIKTPAFVSTQGGFHVFHSGPEFRYFFSKYGCNVKEIETQNSQASTMLMVADQTTYTHGEDRFNELTLFGPSQDTQTISCLGNLNVHVLVRPAN